MTGPFREGDVMLLAVSCRGLLPMFMAVLYRYLLPPDSSCRNNADQTLQTQLRSFEWPKDIPVMLLEDR